MLVPYRSNVDRLQVDMLQLRIQNDTVRTTPTPVQSSPCSFLGCIRDIVLCPDRARGDLVKPLHLHLHKEPLQAFDKVLSLEVPQERFHARYLRLALGAL